jgi:murein L,D-transpeptidase YcbB/YkuD
MGTVSMLGSIIIANNHNLFMMACAASARDKSTTGRQARLRPWLAGLLVLLAAAAPPAAPAAPPVAAVQDAIAGRVARLRAGEDVTAGTAIIASSTVLPALYEKQANRPLWQRGISIVQLLEAIAGIEQDGLVPADYNPGALKALLARRVDHPDDPALAADLDLLLTDSLVRLGYHLSFGKVDPEALDPEWNMTRFVANPGDVMQMAEAIRTGNVDRLVLSLRPAAPVYGRLRNALATYREYRLRGGWVPVPAGPTLGRGMSDPRVVPLRARLVMTGDMPAADPDSPRFDAGVEAGVKHFQQRHGLAADGRVGKNTLAALNVPVAERISQIRANLERARWVLHNLPETFLLVDIAGFRVSFIRNGKKLLDSRAQVGKPYRETPVFRGTLTYMEINPTWTVPPTILTEDILPAVRHDPGYLERRNMQVIDYNGNVIDSAAIDWSRYRGPDFPYLIRQGPGPENALGRIKFMFPNRHLVYLHDTPNKRLFGRAQRAFSSGCIRIQEPYDLAGLLVAGDPGWDREKIIRAVDSLQTRTIHLKQPVTIILLYRTVSVDTDGSVLFKRDIYERDPAIVAGLAAGSRLRQRTIIRGQVALPPDTATRTHPVNEDDRRVYRPG